MDSPLISFLQLLTAITKEEATLIQSCFEFRTFKEGEILLREGNVCQEQFFICKGILRIFSVNERGIERTHFFFRENQFCTIFQSFEEHTPAEAGIQAACEVTVLSITKTKLLALYQKLPYLKGLINQLNQQRMLDKINSRNLYIGEDAESQYKLFLLQQPDIALRVAQKDIASFLGITPQSLSRIRKNIR